MVLYNLLTILFLFPIFLGWVNSVLFHEKEQLVATLLLHEVIWKREAAINQILQGLTLLGLLDVVRKFPTQFIIKFVHSDVLLTGNELLKHLVFVDPSNHAEERTKELFCRYIKENVTVLCGKGNIIQYDLQLFNNMVS